MARGKTLFKFVKKHNLKIISIADLIRYIRKLKTKKVEEVNLPTKYGNFKLHLYEDI